jgi:hypothetical protein
MRSQLTILGFLLAGALAWGGPADLLITGIPSPGDVIKVIDALTKKDSKTSVDVKVAQTTSQGKLLVARSRADVVMERSSKNWRGRVTVNMTVPTEISYSVDLSEIRSEHLRVDPLTKKLFVKMPPIRVEDVTPLLADLKSENSYKAVRHRWFDGNTSRDLQNVMLKHDYQHRARNVGEVELEKIQGSSKARLREFLQTLLQPTSPGLIVVIE